MHFYKASTSPFLKGTYSLNYIFTLTHFPMGVRLTFIRLMPKGINILGVLVVLLFVSISISLSIVLFFQFLQHSISNWHNS